MKVISSSGPIIHLSWIDRLDILASLYSHVLIPPAVAREILPGARNAPGTSAIRAAFSAGWLDVVLREPDHSLAPFADLDAGEAEALALWHEADGDLILLDDARARAAAKRRNAPLTGTIGLLQRARQRQLVPAAYPLLLRLSDLGFWVSAELLDHIRGGEELLSPP